jgi:hypothetical protein
MRAMNPGLEQVQQLTTTWLDFATRMTAAGLSFQPDQSPPDAARHVRDVTLDALGREADKYMRSPQFLQAIKQTLDTSIAARKQLNTFLAQAHHSVQGVAKQDMDALSLSVRQMQTRVLDRLEQLIERMDEVSRRLEAMESPSESQSARVSTEPGME